MAKSPVGVEANRQDSKSMIEILEHVGKALQPLLLQGILSTFPQEIRKDKEKIVRFLLLVAFLDQQAESPSARQTAINIWMTFGDNLFSSPQSVIVRIDKLAALKEAYKVSPAIGRVLPRFGWMALRVGGFLIYEMTLGNKRFSEELGTTETPNEALNLLHSNALVEAILRDKAARLFISWIGHPDLGIDISEGRWKPADFEMPVDGHVGKVFSRTGMVSEILHERKRGKTERWNVIAASHMRPSIQQTVTKFGADSIMVDHGAYQIGDHCCPDDLVNISCDYCQRFVTCDIAAKIKCPGYCLLSPFCKRNLDWRAY